MCRVFLQSYIAKASEYYQKGITRDCGRKEINIVHQPTKMYNHGRISPKRVEKHRNNINSQGRSIEDKNKLKSQTLYQNGRRVHDPYMRILFHSSTNVTDSSRHDKKARASWHIHGSFPISDKTERQFALFLLTMCRRWEGASKCTRTHNGVISGQDKTHVRITQRCIRAKVGRGKSSTEIMSEGLCDSHGLRQDKVSEDGNYISMWRNTQMKMYYGHINETSWT